MKFESFLFSFWSLLFAVSLYFLVTDRPPLREGQAIALLSSFKGDVQFRPYDDFQWIPVINSQQFSEGTTLSTGKNARAAVRLSSGRVIEISENSQILISVEQDPTAANEVSIFLLHGKIDVSKEKELTVASKANSISPIERVMRAFSNPNLFQRKSEQTVALRVGKQEIALGGDSTVKAESKVGSEPAILSVTGNTQIVNVDNNALKPAATATNSAAETKIAKPQASTPIPEPELGDSDIRQILKNFELKKSLRSALIWNLEGSAEGELKSLSLGIDGGENFRKLAHMGHSRQISVVFSAKESRIIRRLSSIRPDDKFWATTLGRQELEKLIGTNRASVIPEKIDVRISVRSYNVSQSTVIEEQIGNVFVGSLITSTDSWFRVDAWEKRDDLALSRSENWLLSLPYPDRKPSFSIWVRGLALRSLILRLTGDLSSILVSPSLPTQTAFNFIRNGEVGMHFSGLRKTAIALGRRFRMDAIYAGNNATYLSESEWISKVLAGTLAGSSVRVILPSGGYELAGSVLSEAPLSLNLLKNKTMGVLLGNVQDLVVLKN